MCVWGGGGLGGGEASESFLCYKLLSKLLKIFLSGSRVLVNLYTLRTYSRILESPWNRSGVCSESAAADLSTGLMLTVRDHSRRGEVPTSYSSTALSSAGCYDMKKESLVKRPCTTIYWPHTEHHVSEVKSSQISVMSSTW